MLCFRHGIAALFEAIKLLKNSQCRDLLKKSVEFLLKKAKFICRLLSTASDCGNFELLRTDGCLEYILECGFVICLEILQSAKTLINFFTDSSLTPTFDTVSIFLHCFVELDFRSIILDVFIGLDLLASVNYDHEKHLRICIEDSNNNNFYFDKLSNLLSALSSLITDIHFGSAFLNHVSNCPHSMHTNCCWSCKVGQHSDWFEIRNSNSSTTSVVCTVQYLEQIIFECYRNSTNSEIKDRCLWACENYPSCCCKSNPNMFTSLLQGFGDLNSSMQRRVLKCLTVQLRKCRLIGSDYYSDSDTGRLYNSKQVKNLRDFPSKTLFEPTSK